MTAHTTVDLLREINDALARYIVFTSEHQGTAMAAWVMMAHAAGAMSHLPVPVIESPVPGCGKTTLLKMLHALCPNALITCETTSAGLARYVNANRSRTVTILLDEADSALLRFNEPSTVINSGFERGGVRLVTNMTTGEPETHDLFCPKVIARIVDGAPLPSATRSRTFSVFLNKAKPGEISCTLPKVGPELERLLNLRRRLEEWGAQNVEELATANPEPPFSDGRLCDVWRPLYAIANHAGEEWPAKMRAASLSLAPCEPESGPLAVLIVCQQYLANREEVLTADLAPHIGDALGWDECQRAREGKLASALSVCPRRC